MAKTSNSKFYDFNAPGVYDGIYPLPTINDSSEYLNQYLDFAIDKSGFDQEITVVRSAKLAKFQLNLIFSANSRLNPVTISMIRSSYQGDPDSGIGFYPIIITPTSKASTDSLLNDNGGVVTINNKKMQGVREKEFLLPFYQPIDLETVIFLVQMLSVQNPNNNKIMKQIAKGKESLEVLMNKHCFEPIFKLLTSTAQNKTLEKLNKRLQKDAKISTSNEEEIKNGSGFPKYNNTSVYADIKEAELAISVTTNQEYINKFNENLLMFKKEASYFETFKNQLEQDIKKVFTPDSVQANIDKGTNFGKFCLNYSNVFTTLSKGWNVKDIQKKKESTGVKKERAADKKALLTTTPNVAKLQDQRDALESGQRILKVPFKKTATFNPHADFKTALSVLDEMRSETVSNLFDKQVDILQIADSAPIPSEKDFLNSLRGLTKEQRALLRTSLQKRYDENEKKIGKNLQNIKRQESSPKFKLAQALTGIKSIFPIKTANGVIDIPDINLDSISGMIGTSISANNSMGQNFITNTLGSIAGTISDVGSSISGLPSNLPFNLGEKVDLSFLRTKTNSSSTPISSQLADMKKIIEKPSQTTNVTKTVKQGTLDTLRQYQDSTDELKKTRDENDKIKGYIDSIDIADKTGKVPDYKTTAQDSKKKTDTTVQKTSDINTKTTSLDKATSSALNKPGLGLT